MLSLHTRHSFIHIPNDWGRRLTAGCATQVELFVNYDCDLDFDDLYESLVNTLSRIAQGVHVKNTGLLPAQVLSAPHSPYYRSDDVYFQWW